ncbi:MAG: gliding motility-associated C-terminal domain-containing protein, partial [Flavobacteriales bacterium]
SFTVSSAGTYSVDVLLNGCSASDAINVAFNPLPVASLGPDQVLCAGAMLNLSVAQPGATYLWQDGSTGSSFTVSSAGTYSVDVLLNGCSASDAIDVAYSPVLVIDIGADQTLCAGDQLVLDATTAGGTYLWQDGSTNPTLTVTSAGSYSVDVTTGTCSASDALTITLTALPVVDLGPDQNVCPGTNVTLDATVPGATYLWQDGSTAATFTSDQPGNYSVQVTAGGCVASDAVAIAHFDLQTVDLGPDVSQCQGDVAALGVNIAGATYLWNTGATSNTINATTAGTYWVDATQNGCTVRDSIVVQVTPLPLVDLGSDPSVCPGDVATLDATQPGATYLWSTGASSPTINEGPGNYSVTVTVNGCSNGDAITVDAFPAAQVSLGNDTTLCPSEQLVVDAAQPGATYLWQDGSTGSSITVTSGGTYTVDLTNVNGCTATDDILVAYASASAVDLGNDTTLCQGAQLLLDATLPGASYMWSTGEQTATISVTSAANYSVTVTQGACTVSGAVNVQVTAAPSVDLGPDVAPCPGENLVFDATSAGATYLWSTGDQTPTIDVTQDGTYSVTVTNAAGCEAFDDVAVTYFSPTAIDLGPDQDLCNGQNVILNAALPGASYEWSTGEQTDEITVGTSGEYWVEVTQGSCSVSDTITLNVNPAPQIDLGADQVLCPGDAVILDANWPGATYAWSTGDATSSINVNTTGTYSVTVDLNGCADTDDVTVTVLSPSAVDLGPDLALCAGDEAQLDATIPGATYLWSTGAVTPTLTAITSDTYWVEVTQGTCSVTDTVIVNVFDPGTVDLGPDVAACEGESVMLDATLADATYLWDDGSTAATRSATTSGNYSVQATIGQCSVSDAVQVTFNPLPVFDIGADVSLCPQTSALFDATVTGASYLWQDGSTAATFSATTAGQVGVTVTLNGCDASDNALVTMLTGPSVALGNDTTLCEGASLTMDVTQPGATYLWGDGSLAPTLTVSTADTYTVEVELNGCTATDQIAVVVFSLASLDLGADVTLCPGETATLNAGSSGSFLWSTGVNTSSITVSQGGLYWVEVQVAACSARDSVQVFAVDLEAPDLGEDLSACAGENVVLSVVPGNATVAWSTGSSADAITVTSTGTYTVTLELDGCSATDAVHVNMIEFVDAVDLGGDQQICPDNPLLLDATTPGATYLWNDGSTSPAIAVATPGTYTVQLSGTCIDASASVVITAGDCDPLVFVPNSFTPNGDGFNDVFFVSVYGPMLEFSLDIFDRWGERIHSSQLPASWDGTMGGQPVQDGVYVYKVRYRARANGDVVAKELIGHVTLLR